MEFAQVPVPTCFPGGGPRHHGGDRHDAEGGEFTGSHGVALGFPDGVAVDVQDKAERPG
ncbi:hypothetical protein [Streptomyces uncialis]|uniref:hypothetical protein n=1 Tax=Streptomyces uncialis TaxID=1048205 RepID=UPI00386C5627|nr:hypothetical protein OG924_18775 [Streptomyces uncialis]